MNSITCIINGQHYTREQILKIERDLAEIEYANEICEIINDIIPISLSQEEVMEANHYCDQLVKEKVFRQDLYKIPKR